MHYKFQLSMIFLNEMCVQNGQSENPRGTYSFFVPRVMLERKELKIDGKNYQIFQFDNLGKQNS